MLQYRVVNTEEPSESLWYFILQGFSDAGGFHGIKSKGLYITAQEALDNGEKLPTLQNHNLRRYSMCKPSQ
jgi:hypothetical protein